jgi:phosphoglycolate phosphatase-like HAD superfamily hydrolase
MKYNRLISLSTIVVLIIIFWTCIPPIRQSQAYLDFADQRGFLGIPHFFDVVSNILFCLCGLFGMMSVSGAKQAFKTRLEKWPYFLFFLMVFFTGVGSSYFHWSVNIDRLFWDRLPISLAFMALLSAVIGDRARPKVGVFLLIPLLMIGAMSVLTWFLSEPTGQGDLRFYVLVQYGSMIVLLLLLKFFPSHYTGDEGLWTALGCYCIAKLSEVLDRQIFECGHVLSGHTLKHIFSGVGTFFILNMLKTRKPVPILKELSSHKKVFIFDFDGTICNSYHAAIRVINAQSDRFHYRKIEITELDELRNQSMQQLLRSFGISRFRLPRLVHALRKEFNQEVLAVAPFVGIREILLDLKNKGHIIGILSSNSEENVHQFIKKNNLEFFDFIWGGSSLFGKDKVIKKLLKHLRVSIHQTVYVGDEVRDIEAAKKVGITMVAVTWGFNSKTLLASYLPDFLVNSMDELKALY